MRQADDTPGRLFVAAACSLSVLTLGFGSLPDGLQVALLVALVAVLGLPHGALDLDIARNAGLWANRPGLIGFIGLYAGLVGLTIGIWMLAPGLALAAFLAISAWHFAGDWRGRLATPFRLAVGACIIALPAVFHAPEVSRIFGLLVPTSPVLWLTHALQMAGVVPLALAGFAATIAARTGSRWLAIEISAVIISAAALPPLLFFTTYFCLLHSPRHLIEAAADLEIETGKPLLQRPWPIVVVTWLGAAGAWALLPTASLAAAAVQVVFIGLAALTVPHMLLIEFWAASRQPVDAPLARLNRGKA